MQHVDDLLLNTLSDIDHKLDELLYMKSLIQKHESLLYGNGNVGLVTRMDRIEQRANSHKWLAGLAGVAFFTSIGDWIRYILFNK